MNKNGMKGGKGTEEERGRRRRREERIGMGKRERERIYPHQYAFPQRPSAGCHIQRGLKLQTVELIWGMKSYSDSPKGP